MLKVTNISRSYDHFKAVDQVSFEIKKGEVVGLLGHNGAGKTTIMKMLCGYLEPDQGEILVNDLSLKTDATLIQAKLGYLPESSPIYPEMIVADYLDYIATIKGIDEDKPQEISRVIKATNISDKLLSQISSLSRGYKQRVGVAQALLGKPDLLILDEPTNGLDPQQTEHMRELIQTISKQATIIISTHIMQEVDAICDRVLILKNGKLAMDAKLKDLQQSNQMLIETSMSLPQLQKLLSDIDAIKDIVVLGDPNDKTRHQSDYHRLQITFATSQHQQKRAEIASRIVASGASIYQFAMKQQDLESVFREVNRQTNYQIEKETSHAA